MRNRCMHTVQFNCAQELQPNGHGEGDALMVAEYDGDVETLALLEVLDVEELLAEYDVDGVIVGVVVVEPVSDAVMVTVTELEGVTVSVALTDADGLVLLVTVAVKVPDDVPLTDAVAVDVLEVLTEGVVDVDADSVTEDDAEGDAVTDTVGDDDTLVVTVADAVPD
jgi:hypothetical protein